MASRSGLLPSYYSRNTNGLITISSNPSSRSILRIREKYLLVIVIAVFIVFSVIGVAYLPELKASNVYKYIKPPDNLGPDLLGLVPPIDSIDSQPQLNPHTARAKLQDQQKLNFKIKQDFNISQLNAVLPKPNINSFMPQDVQRHDFSHNSDNNNNDNNNVNIANHNNNDNNDKEWTPLVLPSGEDPDEEMVKRRNFIKDMMKVSWNNYVTFAWGENELKPVSKKGHSAGIFGTTKLGLYQ